MRGPYRKRRVDIPPRVKQFKPVGIPSRSLSTVILTIDEYEGLRLADYLDLDHQQSADKMNVSRPTFSRLIEKARHKVALALIEGKNLLIEGGNIDFVKDFYKCPDCGEVIELAEHQQIEDCPGCASRGRGRHGRGRRDG